MYWTYRIYIWWNLVQFLKNLLTYQGIWSNFNISAAVATSLVAKSSILRESGIRTVSVWSNLSWPDACWDETKGCSTLRLALMRVLFSLSMAFNIWSNSSLFAGSFSPLGSSGQQSSPSWLILRTSTIVAGWAEIAESSLSRVTDGTFVLMTSTSCLSWILKSSLLTKKGFFSFSGQVLVK